MAASRAQALALPLVMSMLMVAVLSVFAAKLPQIIAYAQEELPKVPLRALPLEFLGEDGCPVAVSSARAELELDPFGAPLAARIYIDYKNVGARPIQAVKFRLRFADEAGKDRGTWHAPHALLLSPGAQAAEKWRHMKVDPRTTELKVRVLQVKFADGSEWQTSKMQRIATPAGGAADKQSVDSDKAAAAASGRDSASASSGGATGGQEAGGFGEGGASPPGGAAGGLDGAGPAEPGASSERGEGTGEPGASASP